MEVADKEVTKNESPTGLLERQEEKVRRQIGLQDLTIMEHMLIQSSYTINGEFWGSKEVIRYLKQEDDADKLREKMLTPIALLENKKSINEINGGRLEKRMVGPISILNLDQQVKLGLKSLRPYVDFGSVNEKGEISGEWRIGLTDWFGKEVDSSMLKLELDFKKYFTLRKDPAGMNQILKFNPKR